MTVLSKMAKAIALGVAILAPLSASAQSLGEVLAQAYNHSGLLQQNRALLRAADEDVAAATAALRPVISYSLTANYSSITRTTTSNAGISASLVLFDFGSSELRREIAKQNVLSLREALRGVEQNVLLSAVSAYTAVLRDASIVNLRENNVRLIEQELQAANDRFEVGEITRTDVAFAEARLASAKAALVSAKGFLEISREQYRASVGDYPGALSAVPALPATAASLSSARAIARQRHPDMAQAQYSVKVSDLNIELAKAALKPVLTGNANLNVAQGGNESTSIGLNLSGPIYRGGALASAYRKAVAQKDASRAGLHLTRHAVDQAVGNAWFQLEVANSSLKATEEQIRASRVAFRGVRQEAEVGSRTTLDVLNAEQELLDAEAARISAETDRYVAVYNLLAAMGLLNVQHLKLGVATYDPLAYYNAVKSAPLTAVSPQGKQLDKVLRALGKK